MISHSRCEIFKLSINGMMNECSLRSFKNKTNLIQQQNE